MNSSLPDDRDELEHYVAEQEALNRTLQEKLNEREREIDYLQAQPDKLRRMNFGSRSEKVSRVSRRWKPTLTSSRKKAIPLPLRWMTWPCSARYGRPVPANRSLNYFPMAKNGCCPECGDALSYLGEDAAEQLELMRSAIRVTRTVRENTPVLSAMPSSGVSLARDCWHVY